MTLVPNRIFLSSQINDKILKYHRRMSYAMIAQKITELTTKNLMLLIVIIGDGWILPGVSTLRLHQLDILIENERN